MNQTLIRYICLSITIVTIILVVVFLLVRFFLKVKVQKRIAGYVIKEKNEENISLVDLILKFFFYLVSKFSGFFNKHHMFKNYRTHLEKYLIYLNEDKFSSIDLVSAKFITAIFIDFLYFAVIGIRGVYFKLLNFIIINILSFYIVDVIVLILYKSKKKLIEEQLLQAVIIMNSAFKSGKNIYQAVQIIKDELPSPMKEEFTIIAKDLKYGLDVNTIFDRFYNRVKVEEAKYIASSLSLLTKTGGSIVTVFNMIEKRFYNRLKIRNELKSLTASSKFLSNTLCLLPFIYIFFIWILNPSFFKPLYTTTIGFILDILIILLYTSYVVLIKNVMKVDEV